MQIKDNQDMSPMSTDNQASSSNHYATNSAFSRQNIQQQQEALPIFPAKQQIIDHIRKNACIILMGETGSGKTTQLPQFILDSGIARDKTIAVTQPRRVAAMTVASRVAEEMGTEVGQKVGYTVRFEDVTSPSTRIKFLTDGMLLREAMLDPKLMKYSVVILDEAHERTVHTDVLFGVVKACQKQRKEQFLPHLKVIVMSATMDVDHFSNYFNKAPVLYLEGRQFPIDVFHSKQAQEDYLFASMVTLFQIHREAPADQHVLVFLTGQEEIESFVRHTRKLAKELDKKFPPMKVCPLFASLPPHQQMEAFKATMAGMRKVVVSTNIAETSVTIDGIQFVIDSGRVKARNHVPATGLDVLSVQRISQAQAWQRAGRAGRQAAGTCYRCLTKPEFDSLRTNSVPEIQRCSLTTVMLQLLALGIKDPANFDFMDKPDKKLIQGAMVELYLLGALKSLEEKQLSEIGQQMAAFPLDPRFTKILLAAKDLNCLEEVLSIVALLSSDAIFVNAMNERERALSARQKFHSAEGDHITLLNVFRAFNSNKQSKAWCRDNFVNYRSLMYAVEVKKQLKEICQRNHLPVQSCLPATEPIRRCLLQGLFLSVAELQREGGYVTLGSKQKVLIHPSSVLFGCKPECVVFTELVQTGNRYVKSVSVIQPEWVQEVISVETMQLIKCIRRAEQQ